MFDVNFVPEKEPSLPTTLNVPSLFASQTCTTRLFSGVIDKQVIWERLFFLFFFSPHVLHKSHSQQTVTRFNPSPTNAD